MSVDNSEVLAALIERLTEDLRLAKGQSLPTTTHLLEMAILDLRSHASGITDADLKTFTEHARERTIRHKN